MSTNLDDRALRANLQARNAIPSRRLDDLGTMCLAINTHGVI